MDDYRTPDKRYIVSHLLKIAEQLKINICNDLNMLMGDSFKLPALINSDNRKEVYINTDIDTKHGSLKASKFSLSFKEFNEVMKVFLEQSGSKTTKEDNQKVYNSIFNPLESALRKAHLNKNEELDYVLFIGGSSKNPYIANALSTYFDQSELLIPRDLQKHVSKGAAIHSLIVNGFGKNIIQPITSERIIVITKNEVVRTLIPASTEIPSGKVEITDLVVDHEGQEAVELPICVGNKDKMLFNIKIPSPQGRGFHQGEHIKLTVEYTVDKLLKTEAECNGQRITPEQLNPFANTELSTEQREVVRAERELSKSQAENGGTPSKAAFRKLINAYVGANMLFQAAEASEEMDEYYPGSVSYNQVGIFYSNSGNREKAIKAYERALEKEPNNATILSNLAIEYKYFDSEKYKEYVRKAYQADSSDPVRVIQMAEVSQMEGNQAEAQRLRKQAYDEYVSRFNNGRLHSWDYN